MTEWTNRRSPHPPIRSGSRSRACHGTWGSMPPGHCTPGSCRASRGDGSSRTGRPSWRGTPLSQPPGYRKPSAECRSNSTWSTTSPNVVGSGQLRERWERDVAAFVPLNYPFHSPCGAAWPLPSHGAAWLTETDRTGPLPATRDATSRCHGQTQDAVPATGWLTRRRWDYLRTRRQSGHPLRSADLALRTLHAPPWGRGNNHDNRATSSNRCRRAWSPRPSWRGSSGSTRRSAATCGKGTLPVLSPYARGRLGMRLRPPARCPQLLAPSHGRKVGRCAIGREKLNRHRFMRRVTALAAGGAVCVNAEAFFSTQADLLMGPSLEARAGGKRIRIGYKGSNRPPFSGLSAGACPIGRPGIAAGSAGSHTLEAAVT